MKILVYNVMFLQGISDQYFWLCPALFTLVGLISLALLVFTGILLFSKRYNPSLNKQKEDSVDNQINEVKDTKEK